MPARRKRNAKARRGAVRRPRLRDLADLVPFFLRPTSKAWPHWNRAAIEFLHGVRAAIDECIEEIERPGRRREAGTLKRIEVA